MHLKATLTSNLCRLVIRSDSHTLDAPSLLLMMRHAPLPVRPSLLQGRVTMPRLTPLRDHSSMEYHPYPTAFIRVSTHSRQQPFQQKVSLHHVPKSLTSHEVANGLALVDIPGLCIKPPRPTMDIKAPTTNGSLNISCTQERLEVWHLFCVFYMFCSDINVSI